MTNKLSVFFDLDGTLFDTAPDLHAAMQKTLSYFDYQPIAFERFRPHVHTGTKSMILESFGIDDTHPDFNHIRETFLQHYQAALTEKTDYFPGIPDVLEHLDTHKTAWGIVTSKPGWLAEPLLKHFALDQRSQCIVSGDTLDQKKPHPAPLLHACALTQTQANNAIYVGDTEVDVMAAKAAGMKAIAVLYGYHRPGSEAEMQKADHVITSPLEILNCLS